MYIWCCVHVVHVVLCTYGVVCMIVQVMLFACGTMYMLYKWRCVQMVLCTCRACGTLYMWCHVHVMHVVLCTCGIVYTLYRWCGVHVALCTHCVGGDVYM